MDAEQLAHLTKRKQEIDDELAGNREAARLLGCHEADLQLRLDHPDGNQKWSLRWILGEVYRAGREAGEAAKR